MERWEPNMVVIVSEIAIKLTPAKGKPKGKQLE
jgi:hypothetical protein